MEIRRITEVGVAVREFATGLFVDLLGAETGEVVEVPRYDRCFRMCRVGKVDFELMEPTADTGVIADFLATVSHPSSLGGVLFEFIQYPKGYATP